MKPAPMILALLLATACSPSPKPAPGAETPAAPPTTAPPAPSTTAPATVPNADDDICNAAAYASLVGKSEKDPAVPPAGPDVRHIHPDDQVTLDYRVERLNIDIDAKGVITGLRCG